MAIQNGTYQHGNRHLIELKNVGKAYATAAGEFVALRDVNLAVDAGEFVAIIGKSGSGKSTLTNMITGIDRPSAGEVFVGDTAVHDLNEGKVARWRGRQLGIIFQFFQLLPTLTVIENVMLPMDFAGLYAPRERQTRAFELLDRVDMSEHAYKLPTAISGGQQQRVAIARALANDPPIVVADEPTGNLDSRTADAVFDLFGKLVAEGKTVVMVTHDEEQAQRVSRAIVVADGEIINEYLARAFPALNQELLLQTTRELEPLTFRAGDEIVVQNTEPDKFYIMTKGEAEVMLNVAHGGHDHDIRVAMLEPGEYFGETSLLLGGARNATIRAVNDVEVVALQNGTFQRLLDSSEITLDELKHVMQARRQNLLEATERVKHHV